MTDYIPVSAVIACHICPRRYYFERSDESEESLRYTVCKQVSTHLGEYLDDEEIWREILCILPEAPPEARDFLDECIAACRETAWRTPVQIDLAVESDTLGIRGKVDKIFEDGTFAIVRSSVAPKAGAYGTDRLRVACYAACLKETLGRPAAGGYVEYVASGVFRFVEPQPRDRREMIKAIRAAKGVVAGEIPPRPLRAPCENCPHLERCTAGPRRLSDLF
ncbi:MULTISPECIES: Dna2/Cas4 domain-containing protein [Methanoculleus]|jgi:CRISPR-associated exonuclease Cas4|uniref:CRISPR-associated exonuclease Cas4 n=1 Tax=Methanoculleus thermophilus TaxID=2200 RepID=A0A1G8ZBD1_9EURY|nr:MULTISPECIES: Dna2/Cas4 domain-containing protein [Methanoculleus]NLN09756.1 Dna2/Cas4 domain-containing protein [Methanoculleus thermophilus]SDK11964.1 CRISPR-associated exonuclease Cas4 [Methanoculleus thermophilus]HQD26800.1 Dna2/Cas4 domain-containing protein [Methanoculleus thermophilus]